MENTYLIPAGADCILPTRSEAQIKFRELGLEGEVKLGVSERLQNFADNVVPFDNDRSPSYEVIWICSPFGHFLNAFQRTESFLLADCSFKLIGVITSRTLFFNDLIGYQVEEELDELYIRQIEIYNSTELIKKVASAYGYRFQQAYLCQTRISTQNNREFVYAWEIECLNSLGRKSILLVALFPEEEPLLTSFPQSELGRHYLQNGEKIEHNGRCWQVIADRNLVCSGLSPDKSPARTKLYVVKKPL